MKLPKLIKAPESPPAGSPAERIAAAANKLANLRDAETAAVIEEKLLDKTVRPAPLKSPPDVPALVAGIVVGKALSEVLPPLLAGERLSLVQAVRREIPRQQELIQRELQAAMADAMREELAQAAPQWREIQLERIRAIAALRRANEKARTLHYRLRKIGAAADSGLPGHMLASNSEFFRAPFVGDAPYVFFQTLVRTGVVTEKEIQDA